MKAEVVLPWHHNPPDGETWVCTLIGPLLGLLGILNPAQRAPLGWGALACNGTVALVTAGLILVLSP